MHGNYIDRSGMGSRKVRRVIRNAVRCNYCGDVVESTYRHDFQTCRCGRVSVDGGHDYLRRCANSPDDYTDLSETEEADEDGIKHNNETFWVNSPANYQLEVKEE